jgi:formylglycine-generating enzyme required for sulfatase activity
VDDAHEVEPGCSTTFCGDVASPPSKTQQTVGEKRLSCAGGIYLGRKTMRPIHALGLAVLALLLLSADAVARSGPKSFRDCKDCPEMVAIPAGAFVMGASVAEEDREHISRTAMAMMGPVAGRALPQHRVAVSAFAESRYPITRGEFAAFAKATGYDAGDTCRVWRAIPDDGTMNWRLSHVTWENKKGASWRDPGFPQTDRDPVVCVSWDDAKAYVAWLGKMTGRAYRLPSEAEWEYATRAGSTGARYWGRDMKRACEYENVADLAYAHVTGIEASQVAPCSDGYAQTSPVGRFKPNAFGVYDTLGNVAQWNEDCAHHDYKGAPTDGSAWMTGDCTAHAMRGPSYRMFPPNVRSGARDWVRSDFRVNMYGFRVALSP